MKREQLATRLMATFISELEEQVELLNAELLALETDPADAERLRSLFRIAHTLKGAARAVGVTAVERICHGLESLLEPARHGTVQLGASDLKLLYAAADALGEAGRLLGSGAAVEGAGIDLVLDMLREETAGGARRESAGAAPAAGVPQAGSAAAQPEPAAGGAQPEPATAAAPAGAAAGAGADRQVRVDAARLDDLSAATSRLDTARTGLAERREDLETIHETARRMTARLRGLARERRAPGNVAGHELHAFEDDVRRVLELSGRLAAGSAVRTRVLDHAVHDVAGRVRELRMRPFAEACEGLPRAVRDLAAQAGRQVRLEVRGGAVEADRTVLDGVRDAILQLVRNAVDHGIEPPEARAAAGKAPVGTITVAAGLAGNHLEVSVADDGAGLDLPDIREQLKRRGRPVPANDLDVGRAIFEGGLSTRTEATSISGRGVGLDIVRHAADRIRGSVDVSWEAGRGTTFTLTCPPTLATLRALIVSVGSVLLAVPTDAVERVMRVRMAEIRTAEGRRVLTGAEGPIPLVSLARLLPVLTAQRHDPVAVMVLASAGRRVGLVVDDLLTEQEVVLSPLDAMADPSPHLSGATLLGPGRVALVLNPASLLAAAGGETDTDPSLQEAGEAAQRHTILVVDDSITTRTLEQSILAAAGFRVLTAVDGADGWRQLQEHGADLVVADVEMPRMDGFALCRAIRESKRFRQLPVVLVTALASPEHRARGMEAGADAYITKSAFDQKSLLDTVRQLLG